MASPWYREGLAFECQRCRACCGGEPGYVWTSPQEMERMAAELGREVEDFRTEYSRKVGGRTSLRERPNGDCVLLGPAGCLAYRTRPAQCRPFPFWPENLSTPAAWKRTGGECPGTNCGRLHTLKEIRSALAKDQGGG